MIFLVGRMFESHQQSSNLEDIHRLQAMLHSPKECHRDAYGTIKNGHLAVTITDIGCQSVNSLLIMTIQQGGFHFLESTVHSSFHCLILFPKASD